ncbi:hypothetical protein UFOVP1492_30 [uncultured Caudovirales phage]|uniref:Uncharacterized protein n=1 Tax=uncultured Caudovirales phage TaxID=2100421 RepID=A0A6J5QY25_9CAUD|nr:hypothetical protein UFOVP1127_104 [uncultured Caudovirales phage]CAB4193574.1 hypothetical protein UFOVP1242_106 [uncultured Caudovirales phage]CAB4217439.1 hypothetical protein UFOVP1492_30 [uncultured Caudovirales phage]CAB5231324.1 hypothetical protein UFOVP1580_59 [uncultured Caudovirales phage]
MSKFKLTYTNGEIEELENLDQITPDQRSDVENGIAQLTDEDGNAVELPEVGETEIPEANGGDELTEVEDEQ